MSDKPDAVDLLASGEELREDYKLRYSLSVAAVRRLRAACRMSLTSFETMWGRAVSKESKTGRVMAQLKSVLEETKDFEE